MDAAAINESLKQFLAPSRAASALGIGKRAVIYACERGALAGAVLVAGRWWIHPAAVQSRLTIHGPGRISQRVAQSHRRKSSPGKDLKNPKKIAEPGR